MKLIMTYYKKMIITYKKLFVMSFVIMAAVTVSNLLIPCWMRFLVDSVSQANSLGQKELLFLLAAFAAFLSCMGFNTWMEIRWYLLLDKLGGLCMRDLTLKMEAALAAASLSDADKIGAEVLKHTMYADVLDVFRVTGHHIPSFISAVLTTIVCMVLAFAFSIKFVIFGAKTNFTKGRQDKSENETVPCRLQSVYWLNDTCPDKRCARLLSAGNNEKIKWFYSDCKKRRSPYAFLV